jgi:acetolactate synthase regulatory subunit
MCTIKINIIQKSHSIEEREIKNLENQLSKELTDCYQVSIHKSGPAVAVNVW